MQFIGRLIPPYQPRAVDWMVKRETDNDAIKGGFLCDEMGLGKTIEVLATICNPGTYDGKTLIISPASVVPQWRTEIEKFVKPAEGGEIDIRVVSYNRLQSDPTLFATHWHRIVYDEAHELRNYRSKRHHLARKLRSTIAWVVTGTPVFNRLSDFQSLGMLAGIPWKWILENTSAVREKFVLRRTKDDVCRDNERLRLPPMKYNLHEIDMSADEIEVYQEVWAHCRGIATEALKSQMKGYYQMLLMECLLRVRQCAIHPQLFFDGFERKSKALRTHGKEASKKFEQLSKVWSGKSAKFNLLEEIMNHVEKTIIFTQFSVEQKILGDILKEKGWDVYKFSGQVDTLSRERIIEDFKNNSNPKSVILVQVKAGGVGLNIQEASRVIITAPSWNPATELQAIARSHRTGQVNEVTVHKLVYNDIELEDIELPSIDQAMLNLQESKQVLTAEVMNDERMLVNVPEKARVDLKTLCKLFLK